MRWLRLLMMIALVPCMAHAGDAEFVGGTVQELKKSVDGKLSVTDGHDFVFDYHGHELRVPYNRINSVEYGQKVDRRLAAALLVSPLFLLSKSRKHFLTVGFQDVEGQQQAVIFRVDKNRIRVVLAGLEARCSVRVKYQDLEARKSVGGV